GLFFLLFCYNCGMTFGEYSLEFIILICFVAGILFFAKKIRPWTEQRDIDTYRNDLFERIGKEYNLACSIYRDNPIKVVSPVAVTDDTGYEFRALSGAINGKSVVVKDVVPATGGNWPHPYMLQSPGSFNPTTRFFVDGRQ